MYSVVSITQRKMDVIREPLHKNTNSLGFRPDSTQTGLYSIRNEESSYYLWVENKGADQLYSHSDICKLLVY